jgi:hypothetical protein
MKRSTRLTSLILASLLVLQTFAYADNIEGRIAGIRPGGLEVTVYDPQGRPYPNHLNLVTDRRTRLSGVTSLSQLRRDDPVSIDVTQQESSLWHADHVILFQEVNARPATQNPPPSMRDVLGNPVVRGALLGAATGAIASSASGGKAGKGALVGAGAGAAASLLGQLFGGDENR